jgi:HEAT repeat protein
MDGAEAAVARSAEELVATLSDLEAGPRSFGELLGLGDRAVDALGAFLRGRPESIAEPRCLAAEILAAIGPPRARAELRSGFETCAAREDLDPVLAEAERSVASAIARHLGALGDREATEPLLAALRQHAWPGCARALGRLGDARAIPVLAARLYDDPTRAVATEALRAFGRGAALDLGRVLIQQWAGSGAEPGWRAAGRAAAAALLAETGERDARMLLVWSLSDPALCVRLAAATGLAHLGGESVEVVLPCLLALLGADSWIDADAAADALMTAGAPALRVLAPLVGDESAVAAERCRGIAVVGRLGLEGGADLLVGPAGSGDASVRFAAAAALGAITGPKASALLHALLADDSPEVRARAVQALGRRGSAGLRALAPLLGDADERVAAAARDELLRAGADALPVLSDVLDGRVAWHGGWTGTRRGRSTAAALLRACGRG